MRRLLTICSIGALALVGVACDDDDNGNGNDAQALCDRLEEIRQIFPERPSDDDLDELVDVAPSEIRDDVQTLVAMEKEHGDDPTYMPTDEEIDTIERFNSWAQENCELPDPEEFDIEELDPEEFDIEDLDLEEIEPEQPANADQ